MNTVIEAIERSVKEKEINFHHMVSSSIGKVTAALDLLRRLPPQKTADNVNLLVEFLSAEEALELRNAVDIPSVKRVCPDTQREYLQSSFNLYRRKLPAEGDKELQETVVSGHRSPWSNKCYDADGQHVAGCCDDSICDEDLRAMEIVANEAFATYCGMYYDSSAVSSVYLRPIGDDSKTGFAGVVLIKKETDPSEDGIRAGSWDAVHVVEVAESSSSGAAPRATMRLTSTVMLHLDTEVDHLDAFLLAGAITRQSEQTVELADSADRVQTIVALLGGMVEQMESHLRSTLQEIYFGKTHDIVNEIRPIVPAGYLRHQSDLQREMAERLKSRKLVE